MTSSTDQVATAFGGGKFVDVVVVTREGAKYAFPDMTLEDLKRVLPESGRIPEGMPALMMVNVSVSVLTIPLRIVKYIEVNGEKLWACPA
jgi:hypothetical protein